MMLTRQEKADLYSVIVATIGPDREIEQVVGDFNEQTVEQVEKAICANVKCNRAMKDLLIGLTGGANLFMRGWLRRSLKTILKGLKDERLKLNGYGCWVGTKANWKSAIIITTI